MIRAVFLLLVLCIALPAFAVEPDEILDDPVLEDRARELSKGLRCLVCRNESIDESNAELAKDLRLLVRERLVAGDNNDEVIAYVVARYGEYVLLTPQKDGANLLLWLAGPVMFGVALLTAGVYLRSRRSATERKISGLSGDEEARLKELLERD